MEVPTVVKYIGYAVAGGLGVYYLQAFYYVSVAQGEQGKVEQEIIKFRNSMKDKQSRTRELESKVETMARNRDIEQEDVGKLQTEIVSARSKLADLETQLSDKQNRILDFDDKIQTNRKRVIDMRGEIREIEGSITMSEIQLLEAKKNVRQATDSLNPLRHPSFRALIGSS